MSLRTKKGQQFSLLCQLENLGNALQASGTKFRLFALFLHFIGCIAFLAFVPEPSSERLDTVAPFVKPFLLSIVTLSMPWTYLFATLSSDTFSQALINSVVDFSDINLQNETLQNIFETPEKNEFFKRTRTELILCPILSLVIGLFFIMLSAWKLGIPILLSLLALFLLDGFIYFISLNKALGKLYPTQITRDKT